MLAEATGKTPAAATSTSLAAGCSRGTYRISGQCYLTFGVLFICIQICSALVNEAPIALNSHGSGGVGHIPSLSSSVKKTGNGAYSPAGSVLTIVRSLSISFCDVAISLTRLEQTCCDAKLVAIEYS